MNCMCNNLCVLQQQSDLWAHSAHPTLNQRGRWQAQVRAGFPACGEITSGPSGIPVTEPPPATADYFLRASCDLHAGKPHACSGTSERPAESLLASSVCLWQAPMELFTVSLLFQERTVAAAFMSENQVIYSTSSNSFFFLITFFSKNNQQFTDIPIICLHLSHEAGDKTWLLKQLKKYCLH